MMMMMMHLRLLAFLQLFVHVLSKTVACSYNSECSTKYKNLQSKCFMEATFSDKSREGYCNGGRGFFDFGSKSGQCVNKRAYKDDCIDVDNGHNDDCVTRFCSTQTRRCELRTSGCANWDACWGAVFSGELWQLASGLNDMFVNMVGNGGSDPALIVTCDSPDSQCDGEVGNDPDADRRKLPRFKDIDLMQGTGLKVIAKSGSFNLHMNKPKFNGNLKKLQFTVSTGYELSLENLLFEVSGEAQQEKEISKTYTLSTKSKTTGALEFCASGSAKKCQPQEVFHKAFKFGKVSVTVKIELQLHAIITGKVSAGGNFKSTFAVVGSPTFSDTAGITLDVKHPDRSSTFHNQVTPDFKIELQGADFSSTVDADLSVSISPEMTVYINSVPLQFSIQPKVQFRMKSAADSNGCLAGRASAVGGFGVGFIYPGSKDLSNEMNSFCNMMIDTVSTVGIASSSNFRPHLTPLNESSSLTTTPSKEAALVAYPEVRESSIDIYRRLAAPDGYGTHCVYPDNLNSKTSKALGCSTIVSGLTSIIDQFTKGKNIIPSYTVCNKLVNMPSLTITKSAGSCRNSSNAPDFSLDYNCMPFATSMTIDEEGGKKSCFAGTETVQLESGEVIPISNVKIGDRILSANAKGDLSYSDVVFVPHLKNQDRSQLIQILTGPGKDVKTTWTHLLLVGPCGANHSEFKLVQAAKVEKGSCLVTVDGQEIIKGISYVSGALGLYSAITMNEYVVVNGVVASPFAFNHAVPDRFYDIHRLFYSYMGPSVLNSTWIQQAHEDLGVLVADSLVPYIK